MDRNEWATELAESVLACAHKRDRAALIEGCDRDSLLAAWVVVHVATGHATGVTARDMAIALETWRPGHDWPTMTVQLISAFRGNGLPPEINEDLAAAGDSLLQLLVSARGYDVVRPDLLAHDGAGGVASRHRDVEAAPEPDPTPILDQFARGDSVAQEQPLRLATPHLDVHRRAVGALRLRLREDDASGRELAAPYLRGLEAWLTPIEFAALFETSDHRLLLDEALDASKRIIEVPYTMPGGWADVYPNEERPHTPEWLRDHVVTGGARSQKYTTGSLHTWVLVSEGSWDRARVARALRDLEKIGLAPRDDGFDVRVFLPEFAGDPDERGISYHYHFDDPDQLRDVLVMLATGIVRFEAFALEGGSLNFLGARSVPLPPDLIGRMYAMVRQALGPDPSHAVSQLGIMKARLSDEYMQAEARFVGSENARYEQLWNLSLLRPTDDLSPTDREDFEAVRRGYLAAESRMARLLLGGQPVDEESIAGTARRDFEMAVSARPNQWHGTQIRLDVLEENQAFLHVEYRDGALDWTAAGSGPDGPWYHSTATQIDARTVDAINGFREVRHLAASGRRSRIPERAAVIDNLVTTLSESVTEMAELLASHDVAGVVASPGADLDGVPIHLLDFGTLLPSSITYAPSTSFLAAIGSEARDGESAVFSFAGRDDDIPNVRIEASVVASLQVSPTRQTDNVRPVDLLTAGGSSVIHISCHGLAVGRFGLRGLMLAPGDASGFVSTADILGSDGFFDTDVVFLSACSSSVADHAQTLVQSFGGVDLAFIAAGARSAVASQWDIGDVPSLIYAAEFHATLARTRSIRRAYDAAQRALKSDLATLSNSAGDQLDRHWPRWQETWRKVPCRTHAVHWGAFRLSGLIR